MKYISSFPFQNLPLALYQEIQGFLLDEDYWDFMNSSKLLFSDVKFETVKLSLNSAMTSKFVSDQSFHKYIIDKIKDPRLQLALSYSNSDVNILSKILSCDSYKLHIRDSCENLCEIPSWIDGLCRRSEVLLEINQDISSFVGIKNIRTLSLNCFEGITNVSHLSNLMEVSLIGCAELVNVSSLNKVHTVYIEDCEMVVNIDSLKNVNSLTVVFCEGIRNISSLTNNSKLIIHHCPNVKDINKLYNSGLVHLETDLIVDISTINHFPSLKFFALQRCTSFHKAGSLKSLPLRFIELYSSPLIDTSPFSHVHTITLSKCNSILRLSGLGSVPCIYLIKCKNIHDISGLGQNKYVWIESCPSISDFSSLKNLPKVYIKLCQGLTNGHDLENVYDLCIDRCSSLLDIHMLGKVYELDIKNLYGVTSLEGLGNVTNITITNCKNLQSLAGLGNNETITLDRRYWKAEELGELWDSDDEGEDEDADENNNENEDVAEAEEGNAEPDNDGGMQMNNNDEEPEAFEVQGNWDEINFVDFIQNYGNGVINEDPVPILSHPLINDPLLLESYQLIGTGKREKYFQQYHCFGRKRQ